MPESAPRGRRTLFGREERRSAREGPGILRSAGATNGAGLVNGGGMVNGRGRVNGSGMVNGRGRVNGSGMVNGRGQVNGSGTVNGRGRINGGALNGVGLTNGTGLAFVESTRARRRALARRTAVILAVLLVSVGSGVPLLYNALFGPSPIAIDGNFSDWAAVPTLPDSPSDQVDNGNINIVAFAATQSSHDLFFYIQVAQGYGPFRGPAGTAGAESFRVLVDSDRSSATGFAAYGLGVDAVIELSGYGGQMRTSVYRVFPAGLADRTNANGLVTAGATRAVVRGNEIEGSLSLSNLGLGPSSAPPFLLVLSQDSLGREDLGDIVFSSQPGVLSLVPLPSSAATLPTGVDVPLVAFTLRAYHQNVTLRGLTLTVDGTAGGGVQLAYARIGPRNETINQPAAAGSQVTVNFTTGGPLLFSPNSQGEQLTIYGRATGPVGVGAVRVLVLGSQDVLTGGAPSGSSGHGSALPPLVFERAYVGVAPASIRIDGAFADWESIRPFDQDPDNDVATTVGAPSPGGPNPPSRINQNIDIRQTRMDANSGAFQVSFYLQVDGSILAGTLLDFPSSPTQVEPGGSGSGGSGPGGPMPDSDIATIYLDADNNFATGWQALPFLGVDKVVQIVGKGGGYGRTAQVTLTSLWSWDPFAQRFNKTDRPLQVGLGSSKLETQVNASDLCSGACGRMRYAFFLQDVAESVDRTVSLDGNVRGQAEGLLFTESATRTTNAYPGEIHVPILGFALFSPSTNEHTAQVIVLDGRIEGVRPDDVVAVDIFPDGGAAGVLDSGDLAAGPLAHGLLAPDGVARLAPTLGLTLPPGGALSGLLTVDIASNASTPAWLNASIGREAGLHTAGVVYVTYSWPEVPPSVRLLADQPGTRAQNNLVINEVNVVSGWIEVFDKTGAATSLTSPSTTGLVIYNTNNNGGNLATNAILVFTGSTNSKGFAAFNYSTPYSTSTRKYFVALWCSNCTAGQDARGRNNNSYVDFVEMPLNASQGAWGRYPDGNVSLFNTTNNTRADNNQLAAGSGAGNPQNNLVVNEVNFVSGWIEVYLTLAFAVSLTSPSTMGLVIYHTNGQGNNYAADALIVFTGSTNAEGFAVFNYSVPYSTSNRRYHVAIWCNNCSAGRDSFGNDNSTAVNDVEMPLSAAQGAWGRYPDGNGSFVNTTNNTRADNNAIPEFSDLAYPLVGILALAPIVHRRTAKSRQTR